MQLLRLDPMGSASHSPSLRAVTRILEESVMTLIRITAAVFILAMPTSSFAQEWIEYVDRTERFCVNFPGQPAIREMTYQPQNGKPVPARPTSCSAA